MADRDDPVARLYAVAEAPEAACLDNLMLRAGLRWKCLPCDAINAEGHPECTRCGAARYSPAYAEHDLRRRACDLAARCGDAYSVPRYRSWTEVAIALLRAGLSEAEAEAVMRSKWTRWAADASEADYGSAPASAVLAFIAQQGRDLHELARELLAEQD